jgi:hypothetical protein
MPFAFAMALALGFAVGAAGFATIEGVNPCVAPALSESAGEEESPGHLKQAPPVMFMKRELTMSRHDAAWQDYKIGVDGMVVSE